MIAFAVLPAAVDLGGSLFWLVFGWATFLWRVMPKMTIDRGSVTVATVSLLLFVLGAHFTAHRTYRRFTSGRPDLPPGWRFRWTLSPVFLTFVLFAAGISLIGATHQVAWLATSKEPLAATVPDYGPSYGTRTIKKNLIKQIGLALHNYADTYNVLPAGGSFDRKGNGWHSWETAIGPYIGVQYPPDMRRSWRDPVNEAFFRGVLPEYLNPELRFAPYRDSEAFGLSHFAANVRLLGPSHWTKWSEVTDDTSNTVMLGEVNAAFRPWGDPVNWRDPARAFGPTPDTFGGPRDADGVTFLMADGSVRSFANQTDPKVLRALATPAAGDSP